MPWVVTPQFTIAQRQILTYSFPGGISAPTIGIELLSVPGSGYRRYGYLWAKLAFTVGGTPYGPDVNGGPIWRRAYVWNTGFTTPITAIYFAPSRFCPIPTQARIIYFTP